VNKLCPTAAVATSHNKQVAPTPRCARLRGTPAQQLCGWEGVSEESRSYEIFTLAKAPASQL